MKRLKWNLMLKYIFKETCLKWNLMPKCTFNETYLK